MTYWELTKDKCPNCGECLEVQYEVEDGESYGIQERCPNGDWKHKY